MKRFIKRTKGLVKGAPAALLLSGTIHLVLFAVFGGIVVFSVIQKMEKKFTPPPPVERPKMELKKPRVKVKKKPKPKALQRIVSKQVQEMPEIRLPESSGLSKGLGDGLGGFALMPDPADISLFGGKNSFSTGNDFEGTFYMLGMDRQGRKNRVSGTPDFIQILARFFASGWNPRSLAMYHRSPRKLYTTFFYIPYIPFRNVLRTFDIPDELHSLYWMAHYQGKIASKTGGKFRFWGRGDDVLAVRVDGKEVLQGGIVSMAEELSPWRGHSPQHRKYWRMSGPIGVGDWFELEPGVPVEMEVVLGDDDHYGSEATLTVEEYGVYYPKNENDGAPILPLFRTSEIAQHLKDEITYFSMPGDLDMTHELIFNVY